MLTLKDLKDFLNKLDEQELQQTPTVFFHEHEEYFPIRLIDIHDNDVVEHQIVFYI